MHAVNEAIVAILKRAPGAAVVDDHRRDELEVRRAIDHRLRLGCSGRGIEQTNAGNSPDSSLQGMPTSLTNCFFAHKLHVQVLPRSASQSLATTCP